MPYMRIAARKCSLSTLNRKATQKRHWLYFARQIGAPQSIKCSHTRTTVTTLCWPHQLLRTNNFQWTISTTANSVKHSSHENVSKNFIETLKWAKKTYRNDWKLTTRPPKEWPFPDYSNELDYPDWPDFPQWLLSDRKPAATTTDIYSL